MRKELHLRVGDYALRITHYALRITHYALRITHYALRITHYALRITHYALRITHYSLLALGPLAALFTIYPKSRIASLSARRDGSRYTPGFRMP